MNDDQLARLLRQVDEPASPNAAFADQLFERLSRETARSRGIAPGLLLVAALMLMAALAMSVAVGSGVLKIPWLSLEVPPTPSGQPIASGALTASPTSSASQPSVQPSPSTGTIVIDGLVRSTIDGLRVRATPTTAGAVLGTINQGQLGFVVAGPTSSDGYTWYQLSGIGLPANAGCEPPVRTDPFSCPTWLGWVAAGQPAGQAWLEAATVSCPASPMNLDALVTQAGPQGPLTALERLACYRSTQIRFRAWWPTMPADAGLGGTCGALAPNPYWLMCPALSNNRLTISESEGFGGVGLMISIDPTSGVTMPTRGQWVEVVAHLDDPAARDCKPLGGGDQDPVSVVLGCRAELVADSVEPVAGPY